MLFLETRTSERLKRSHAAHAYQRKSSQRSANEGKRWLSEYVELVGVKPNIPTSRTSFIGSTTTSARLNLLPHSSKLAAGIRIRMLGALLSGFLLTRDNRVNTNWKGGGCSSEYQLFVTCGLLGYAQASITNQKEGLRCKTKN